MITLVDRVGSGWCEEPWLRFLMGDLAGPTVRDPDGEVFSPDSLIITQRPDLIGARQLDELRSMPNVGLFVISDEWYRRPVESYVAFSYVWRNHFHSHIHGARIRTLPLGPACLDVIGVELPAHACTALAGRSIPVSFSGVLKTTRFAAAKNVARVPKSIVNITGRFDSPSQALGGEAYMQLLAESIFVACPMGNVNMETFRVYEALEMGAIPIVEIRRGFDYFRLLLGDHPLPSVRRWSQLAELVQRFFEGDELERLQHRTRAWWQQYKLELSRAMRSDVLDASPGRVKLDDRPNRVPLATELVKHHNLSAAARRGQLTVLRAAGQAQRRARL